MSGEKIQVRLGWWRQRCGNVVRIGASNGHPDYPWRCAAGLVYSRDGRYFSHTETEMDLVEFLGKNITITSAD
jgi:hypothetical protein